MNRRRPEDDPNVTGTWPEHVQNMAGKWSGCIIISHGQNLLIHFMYRQIMWSKMELGTPISKYSIVSSFTKGKSELWSTLGVDLQLFHIQKIRKRKINTVEHLGCRTPSYRAVGWQSGYENLPCWPSAHAHHIWNFVSHGRCECTPIRQK